MVPIGDGILNVVGGGVDEDAVVIPGSRLDSGVLMDRAECLQLPIADGDYVLGEQRHCVRIGRPGRTFMMTTVLEYVQVLSVLSPDYVSASRDLHVAQVPPLLDIEEGDGVSVAQQEHPGAGIEDLIAVRRAHLLSHLVLQVLDDQLQR